MTYQREFDRKVRLGVVGAGKHSYRNLLPALHYLPVQLSAICDLDVARAESAAREYGVRGVYQSTSEMYANEELDAVLLCVSPQAHPDLACEAFEANLHVWMEKPPATRAAQVRTMMENRGDRVCVVGFKKVFMPSMRKAVEIMSDPKFGPVHNMVGIYPLGPVPADGQRTLRDQIPNDWLANGVHPVSIMLGVGGPVEAVTMHRGRKAGSVCVLEFENGCLGTLHLATGAVASQPVERYMFVGRGCHVEIENSLRVTFQRGIPYRYGVTTDYVGDGLDSGAVVWEPQNHLSTLENKALFTQGIYGELKHFLDCVLEKRRPTLGTLEFAYDVMRVYEAGLLSNGDRVPLADLS